jgi:hypothetical protein
MKTKIAVMLSLLILPALALAQAAVPEVAPLPVVPSAVQSFWVYYVVPLLPVAYALLVAITKIAPEGSKAYEIAKLILSGTTRTTLTIKEPGSPKGFAAPWALVGLATLTILGCAAMKGAHGSTGSIDLKGGYSCAGTVGATDPAACTKVLTWSCLAPLPKDASGTCELDALNASVPFVPAKDWKCTATATAGATPCTKLVALTCIEPVPQDLAGHCE